MEEQSYRRQLLCSHHWSSKAVDNAMCWNVIPRISYKFGQFVDIDCLNLPLSVHGKSSRSILFVHSNRNWNLNDLDSYIQGLTLLCKTTRMTAIGTFSFIVRFFKYRRQMATERIQYEYFNAGGTSYRRKTSRYIRSNHSADSSPFKYEFFCLKTRVS
jgi:hypothetical protein